MLCELFFKKAQLIPYLIPAELFQLLQREEKRKTKRDRARESDVEVVRERGAEVKSKVDEWIDSEGAAEEEAATAAAGKEDKREEQCVSERVISWKQFTLKRQQQGEKKMLNTMAWAHRETEVQGERGEGRGETHQRDSDRTRRSTLFKINKIK